MATSSTSTTTASERSTPMVITGLRWTGDRDGREFEWRDESGQWKKVGTTYPPPDETATGATGATGPSGATGGATGASGA